MSLKTGSRWSNWAWDKPVKAFIWRSSRICRPIGGLPPWFFEESLPHFLLRNNSISAIPCKWMIHMQTEQTIDWLRDNTMSLAIFNKQAITMGKMIDILSIAHTL